MNHCKNCPLGILSIDKSIQMWDKLGYEESEIEELLEDIESNIRCDKLEGKIWWTNSLGCEGIYDKPPNIKPKQRSNKKKLSTRERNVKYKNKLKRMYDQGLGYYPASVDKISVKNSDINYYIRIHRSRNGRSLCQTYKKHSNEKVRSYLIRYSNLSNGSCYKKVFDYHWNTT